MASGSPRCHGPPTASECRESGLGEAGRLGFTYKWGTMTASDESELGATSLRAKERVIRRLADEGMPESEIAWRFRRTPGHVRRVLGLSRLKRQPTDQTVETARKLRPIERLVLRARDDGADPVEIASRLRRSPRGVDQIEKLAIYKIEQFDISR